MERQTVFSHIKINHFDAKGSVEKSKQSTVVAGIEYTNDRLNDNASLDQSEIPEGRAPISIAEIAINDNSLANGPARS